MDYGSDIWIGVCRRLKRRACVKRIRLVYFYLADRALLTKKNGGCAFRSPPVDLVRLLVRLLVRTEARIDGSAFSVEQTEIRRRPT